MTSDILGESNDKRGSTPFSQGVDESQEYGLVDEPETGDNTNRYIVNPSPNDQFNKRNEIQNQGKVKLKPMSPLAASSTVVNLLLATGPFS